MCACVRSHVCACVWFSPHSLPPPAIPQLRKMWSIAVLSNFSIMLTLMVIRLVAYLSWYVAMENPFCCLFAIQLAVIHSVALKVFNKIVYKALVCCIPSANSEVRVHVNLRHFPLYILYNYFPSPVQLSRVWFHQLSRVWFHRLATLFNAGLPRPVLLLGTQTVCWPTLSKSEWKCQCTSAHLLSHCMFVFTLSRQCIYFG